MGIAGRRVDRPGKAPDESPGAAEQRIALRPVPLLGLQRAAGNRAVRRLLQRGSTAALGPSTPPTVARLTVQRRDDLAGLVRLDDLLDRFNVPEAEVIAHLAALSAEEKQLVLGMHTYRAKLLAALTAHEIGLAVDALRAPLSTKLDWLLEGGASYLVLRPRFLQAPPAERAELLGDQARLGQLRDALIFRDFARCMELLGRVAPDRTALLADPAVRAELEAAWQRSQPAARGSIFPLEEGGFIYLDLLTNQLAFRHRSGGPSSMSLRDPPYVADAVVVGTFHTHPNVEPGSHPEASDGDLSSGTDHGVPGIIRAQVNGERAFFSYGPEVRRHLAAESRFGAWSYPGPSGGLAP